MNTRIYSAAIAALIACMTIAPTTASAAEVIAFWDFNDGFDVDDNIPQIVHAATLGNGTIYQQRADTDGNGGGGFAFSSTDPLVNAVEGKSMTWDDISKSGDNDAEFFITTSTFGFKDIMIRFDVEGNDEGGFAEYDFVYALNPLIDVTNPGDVVGTIKDFDSNGNIDIFNNQPIATNALFEPISIDLSGITDLNNQSLLVFRFDDFDGNDSVSFDNILITGTVIPEPTSTAMLLAVAGVVGMRRKRNSFRS
ncbi:hypothetical protein LF1_25920 [Rubripirellula obstinata]|uniref:PEP-CTERM protein-sorting domain-containing protein n=1 Tax=Rubripirellula obstinata TaxID=406547 RepID=A0A5B1CKY4_9BACT|nr:PEP-CTERM sorting domain-containing protein [Rubripirellula obstinata]KAA1260053.1 hypothetical protein LF1_25920 [Rubripirellula obstinata]